MNRRTLINTNHLNRIISSGAAIFSLTAAIMLATGCSKGTPQATNSPRPDPPKTVAPGDNTKAKVVSPAVLAPSLGLDQPDMQIPTQDEIDAAIANQINASNADAAFNDLQKDIDSDGG